MAILTTDKKRAELLKKVQMYSFLVDEARLFLDTHPKETDAIAYYNKNLERKKEAENAYTKLYGPINYDEMSNEKEWTWVKGPWPWEMGV